MMRAQPNVSIGPNKLAGTVKELDDTPLKRKVIAGSNVTGHRYVTWSDPDTGAWEITNVPEGPCWAVALDYTGEYSAQAFGPVDSVPMT